MSRAPTGLRRISLFPLVAPLALVSITCAGLAAAEYGNLQPLPPLEAEPGANLYWHQPGAFWPHGCDEVVQTDWFGYSPRWYFLAELQALRRDNLRSFDFAAVGEDGPTLLGSASLDDEFKGGYRLLVGWSISDWYRLEGSYYGSFHWSASAAVRNSEPNALGGIGNLFSPFTDFGNPPAPGLDFFDFGRISVSSELNNVELNLRRRIAMPPGPFEASFLVGVRYMRVKEDFRYHTEGNVPLPQGAVNEVLTSTNNDMTGVQVGFLAQWLAHPRAWIDFEIKGAGFSNSADLSTRYSNTDENGVETSFFDGDDRTPSAGSLDLSLMLNCQFTRALTFRVGYYAMWMSGVALAADNFHRNTDLVLQGPVLLDDNGRLVHHGPTIGLVGAW